MAKRRKRIEVALKEEIPISKTSSFTIEETDDMFNGTPCFRIIEWDIREDGSKRIDDIREGREKFILWCVNDRFNLLIKIIKEKTACDVCEADKSACDDCAEQPLLLR